MTARALGAWAAAWAQSAPAAAAAARRGKDELGRHGVFVAFTSSLIALNLASLVANALVFRFVEPAAMGVWHTLLLAGSYLTFFRLGVVNGMGRELPFALGRGDVAGARRVAATALACNLATSLLVAAAFLAALPFLPGADWSLGLVAMAFVSASNLYLAYLQATFRSASDFARLARVHWLQAALALLMPVTVYGLGFPGLCLHAALSSLLATGAAHALRPLPVRPRFEPRAARVLLATGLPLFAAGYLQLVATGFDRVILLERGGVEAVGYYAPAVAVLGALAIVPGAVASYVYPRMSFALGQGRGPGTLARMALGAAAVSVAAALPLAVIGWYLAPPLVERFFPEYAAGVPAVRWSLVAGTLWGLSPTTTLLGSLKAWRSLALYIGALLVARWSFPYLLSDEGDPLLGVARGNACAALVVGAISLLLAWRAAHHTVGAGA